LPAVDLTYNESEPWKDYFSLHFELTTGLKDMPGQLVCSIYYDMPKYFTFNVTDSQNKTIPFPLECSPTKSDGVLLYVNHDSQKYIFDNFDKIKIVTVDAGDTPGFCNLLS
jgi:hypothetical protein